MIENMRGESNLHDSDTYDSNSYHLVTWLRAAVYLFVIESVVV